MKLKRKLIVVGHGRGGTSFANEWLNRNGIWTGHETLGPDGIVDSGLSVPTFPIRVGFHAGLTRDQIDFEHKLAVVRNPWKTIATYYGVEHPDAIWIHGSFLDLSEADGDPLAAIAISVVRWTNEGIAYAEDACLRAETWNADAPLWLEGRGFAVREWVEVPRNTVNHRPGKRLTKAQIIQRLPGDIAALVHRQAEELGYE